MCDIGKFKLTSKSKANNGEIDKLYPPVSYLLLSSEHNTLELINLLVQFKSAQFFKEWKKTPVMQCLERVRSISGKADLDDLNLNEEFSEEVMKACKNERMDELTRMMCQQVEYDEFTCKHCVELLEVAIILDQRERIDQSFNDLERHCKFKKERVRSSMEQKKYHKYYGVFKWINRHKKNNSSFQKIRDDLNDIESKEKRIHNLENRVNQLKKDIVSLCRNKIEEYGKKKESIPAQNNDTVLFSYDDKEEKLTDIMTKLRDAQSTSDFIVNKGELESVLSQPVGLKALLPSFMVKHKFKKEVMTIFDKLEERWSERNKLMDSLTDEEKYYSRS